MSRSYLDDGFSLKDHILTHHILKNFHLYPDSNIRIFEEISSQIQSTFSPLI